MFLSLSPVYEQVMMCETLMFVHVINYALVIIVFKGGSNCQSKSMNIAQTVHGLQNRSVWFDS